MSKRIDPDELLSLLNRFQISSLFLAKLGWDQPRTATVEVLVGETTFRLSPVAQKRGVVVFQCSPDEQGKIPARHVQIKIEREVAKVAYENLVLFSDGKKSTLVWLWVSRSPNQPPAVRTHTWTRGGDVESLRQKLGNITWALEEEDEIILSTVTAGLKRAFDRDAVSKKFYDHFKVVHEKFCAQIDGIPDSLEREWYASLMLNRLMFIYFIQRKEFLDGDRNYLSNRLRLVQSTVGEDEFYAFYRLFLVRLFHEGLGGQENARAPDLVKLIGRVPYLNGGFFEVHPIEKRNPAIRIPDSAFQGLFVFFDSYDWHLDDRPLRSSREINPDVLGYIFEKYINQRQMGAYYTKEDITEYIARSTIVSFVLEQAVARCQAAFAGEHSLWNLLRNDPTRYIFDDMQLGVFDARGNQVRLSDLPGHIGQFGDESCQSGFTGAWMEGEAVFQTKTGERGTLPTETWGEYMERRQQCLLIHNKLATGAVTSVEDLITLNLDLRQLLQDIIVFCETPALVRAIWKTIVGTTAQHPDAETQAGLTILDPTCGSGAFLFAALNLLEPIYESCIDKMEELRITAESPTEDFASVLAEMASHPSRKYFIYKCIMLRNLFGVDIMNEATEICKLRLFLKLVSQVDDVRDLEPLPDIDFNIRSGNTLVGYATREHLSKIENLLDADSQGQISVKMSEIGSSHQRFREQQLGPQKNFDGNLKQKISRGLRMLSQHLDHHLARELGIPPDSHEKFEEWKQVHQPFHWVSEFYNVIQNGGFDVVIGNPPYVQLRESGIYTKLGYVTDTCPDLYALCLERAGVVCSARGKCGMIVPLSLTFHRAFSPLRTYLRETFEQNWFSSYANSPSTLFSGTVTRCVIHLAFRCGASASSYTTKLHRWHTEMRPSLFKTLSYSKYTSAAWDHFIPKINGQSLIEKIEAHLASSARVGAVFSSRLARYPLHYKITCRNWLSFGHLIPPARNADGDDIEHTGFKTLNCSTDTMRKVAMCLLNGKIALIYWFAIGDEFHVTWSNIASLPLDLKALDGTDVQRLVGIADELENKLEASIRFATMHGKSVGNFDLLRCREITDASDKIFARAYGFDSVWREIETLYSHLIKPGVKSSRTSRKD